MHNLGLDVSVLESFLSTYWAELTVPGYKVIVGQKLSSTRSPDPPPRQQCLTEVHIYLLQPASAQIHCQQTTCCLHLQPTTASLELVALPLAHCPSNAPLPATLPLIWLHCLFCGLAALSLAAQAFLQLCGPFTSSALAMLAFH